MSNAQILLKLRVLSMTRTLVFFVCWAMWGLLPAPTWAVEQLPPISANQASDKQATADIEVFVREGCPHCAEAEKFLAKLAREKPALKIVIRDIYRDPGALVRLQEVAKVHQRGALKVPAFYLNGQLLVGFADEASTGQLILAELAKTGSLPSSTASEAGSCAPTPEETGCQPERSGALGQAEIGVDFLGRHLTITQTGLPLFTLAMGLLDGFNPCSMWVLVLMISLLASMRDRPRMLAVAGSFIAVEGIAYFMFMASWLNLFLWLGFSRISEIIIAGIALFAGAVNLKDFLAFGRGFSLSIPESAKPGIYARIRGILHAENLLGAVMGAVVLAVLVQIVEFLCTSGFPALYTRILTLEKLDTLSYYAYLLLYNLAYMFDDLIVLGIGVVTLSQRRLQENEGRWLKLVSGLVMLGLGIYLLVWG